MSDEPKYPDMLAWVDLETTGLNPATGKILEVGVILTDGHLDEIARRAWVCKLDRGFLPQVDDWALQQHSKSGLLKEALHASDPFGEPMAGWIRSWLSSRGGVFGPLVPMAGASVHFDRAWLKAHGPSLEDWFHYGNLDVSSIEKIARLWWPELRPWEDRGLHRALPDCEDAIAELRYYLQAGVIRQPMEMGSAPDGDEPNITSALLDPIVELGRIG